MKIVLVNAKSKEEFDSYLKSIEISESVKFGETKSIELSPGAQKIYKALKKELFGEDNK